MDRQLLINYSIFYDGEYFEIIKAIKNQIKVPETRILNALTILDKEYPQELLDLKYPPLVLYYKGDLNLLKQAKISIVGSRMACDYALEATRKLVLNKQNKVIVSGLAKGIDALAQSYAKKTIGVLGCGINYFYPYCHKDLILKVAKEGLLLSEYPELVKPLAFHFPFRNRIIAALGGKLYVMQSKRASGTMTSINEALDLGKEIMVLPYRIFDIEGANNNLLIQEGANIIQKEEIDF